MTPSRRHWPQYIGALLVIILMAGGASAAAGVGFLYKETNPFTKIIAQHKIDPGAVDSMTKVQPGEPQTILLIGSDKRSKKAADGYRTGALSDTLMLARLDPENGATAVLSIPRDTKAQIPQKGGGYRTAKINEAFADGGEALTIKTVKQLLGVDINHVVIVNFNAFQRAVNYLGGLYQDIDHRFYNDNSQGENYATIDIQPGYQLLPGSDTLDWVRFRHLDSDLVRAARQQEFLRSAKNQVATSQLVKNRADLLRIFALYTQTDITDAPTILSVLKLALNSAKQPVRSVRFLADDVSGGTYLTVTPEHVAQMRREFTQLKAASGTVSDSTEQRTARKQQARTQVDHKGLAPGLIKTPADISKPEFAKASFDLAAGPLPLYYPSVRLAQGNYASDTPVRAYDIVTRTKKKYTSYRLTLSYNEAGQYWGIQGTKWRDPPILNDTHKTIVRKGRKLLAYATGSRYRLVAWKSPDGVYWVSNTVSNRLTNAQMLDIAANLRRVPG